MSEGNTKQFVLGMEYEEESFEGAIGSRLVRT